LTNSENSWTRAIPSNHFCVSPTTPSCHLCNRADRSPSQ